MPARIKWMADAIFFIHEVYHPSLFILSLMMWIKKFIAREHNRGRRVHVWTVNSQSKAKELFENNIDGIFTDDPLSMQKEKTKSHPR